MEEHRHQPPDISQEMEDKFIEDLTALTAMMDEYDEQQRQIRHNAYPLMNFVVEQVREVFPEYVMKSLTEGMDRASRDIAHDVFTFLISAYKLGRSGYGILEVECKATHGEFN